MAGELFDAPNQQVVRADGSAPWDEGTGGGQAAAPQAAQQQAEPEQSSEEQPERQEPQPRQKRKA